MVWGLPQCRTVRTFAQAMRLCAARLTEPRGAQTHYQAVCRALFVETLELRAFLARVREAKEVSRGSGPGRRAKDLPGVEGGRWGRPSEGWGPGGASTRRGGAGGQGPALSLPSSFCSSVCPQWVTTLCQMVLNTL